MNRFMISAMLLFAVFSTASCTNTKVNSKVETERAQQTPTAEVAPFLMFIGVAEEAMAFYVQTIDDSEIIEREYYGPGEQGAEGTIKLARFSLSGQHVLCTDSPPVHDFTFTPSMSLFVTCINDDQFQRYADTLAEGGEFLMPPGNYGFSTRFAWLVDRFGVSWQLNLD